MSSSSANPTPLPRWLVRLGSVIIAGHLLALGVSVLAAPSGPWPTPDGGRDMVLPPAFAMRIANVVRPHYLLPLKLTHNYHFLTNRGEVPGVSFNVQLKGAAGETLATLKFPEDNANPWVRHRQALLARALGDDQPVQPPPGEAVAAPGKRVPMVQYWRADTDRTLRLHAKPEHLIRDEIRDKGPVSRPSDLSLLLARSYARYLCRQYGAASAEIIRHHRDAISPVILFQQDVPPGATNEIVADFGELPK